MGWTYTDCTNLEAEKADHVASATRYSGGITAELIAHEWHNKTWFALIRLSGGHYAEPLTWLRIDLIDTTQGQFGYKDGAEEMGMHNENRPSREFAALIYKHIPTPQGYGLKWRERNGVKFKDTAQLELV